MHQTRVFCKILVYTLRILPRVGKIDRRHFFVNPATTGDIFDLPGVLDTFLIRVLDLTLSFAARCVRLINKNIINPNPQGPKPLLE